MACNQMINEITLDRLIGCIGQIGTKSEGQMKKKIQGSIRRDVSLKAAFCQKTKR